MAAAAAATDLLAYVVAGREITLMLMFPLML